MVDTFLFCLAINIVFAIVIGNWIANKIINR